MTASTGQSAALALVGLVLALWTVSGAMQALIRGLNRIHGCKETRGRSRACGPPRSACSGGRSSRWWCRSALLVFGTPLVESFGDWIGAPGLISWLWWALRWPIVGGALFIAIAGILRMAPAEQSAPVQGPGDRRRRWP